MNKGEKTRELHFFGVIVVSIFVGQASQMSVINL